MTSTSSAVLWYRESAGAVADLGVLVPIAVALIVLNGLSPTAVLLPAALLYLVVARVYALPIAVQPLKAFGAVAIAIGAGAEVIAAGALIMGVVFTVLGLTGAVDAVARRIPNSVIRGVQLTVAVLLAKIGYGLVANTPANFTHQLDFRTAALLALGLLVGMWLLRGRLSLVAVALAIAATVYAALHADTVWQLGPTALELPRPSLDDVITAATLLVIPQLPLTFANSCLAPADAARTYFGDEGRRVTPGRLATTLGAANLFAGAVSGMPVCHGAGGLSAHVAFGARSWRAPALIGSVLLVVALGFGHALSVALPAFPVSVLAALLGVASLAHAQLLSDVRGWTNWGVVALTALLGVTVNLAYGVVAGLLLAYAIDRFRRRPAP